MQGPKPMTSTYAAVADLEHQDQWITHAVPWDAAEAAIIGAQWHKSGGREVNDALSRRVTRWKLR